MTMEQFSAVVALLPQLEEAVAEKGERIPRPDYDGKPSRVAEAANESDDDAQAPKANFEATSEEDE
jgi:hypothetical protein